MKPSPQQGRWLRKLPLQDREVKAMNGNHARTVKSLIDRGWAVWDGGVEGWALLSLTPEGKAALEKK